MECINLKERFGKKYRVVYEESYQAQYGPRAYTVDPWLMIIPCQRGHIFPHGGKLLAASTDTRGSTARKLAAMPFVRMHQDGADGITVLFPVERFADVAEVMKPRRRRRLSPEARRAAGERLARFQFGHAVEAPQNELESTQTVLDAI